jgi:HAMP domain-containing protein
MNDILERLREAASGGDVRVSPREAADEIEKLRAALDTARTMLQSGMPEYDAKDVLEVINAALGEKG